MIRHISSLLIAGLLINATLYAQTAETPKSADPAQTAITAVPSAAAAVNSAGPRITFDNIAHDFGIIPYMGDGGHTYVITNTGTSPLVIFTCVKGCGCTSVNWTKDSIMPGKTGLVRAVYDTRKVGHFSRGVDVYSNDRSNSKINLRLTGTVEADPNAPAKATPPVTSAAAKPSQGQGKW